MGSSADGAPSAVGSASSSAGGAPPSAWAWTSWSGRHGSPGSASRRAGPWPRKRRTARKAWANCAGSHPGRLGVR
eukprot:11663052-Alexandrium_andersonii.AAC.1